MTLKPFILGGTAAVALICAGVATPGYSQQAPTVPTSSAQAAPVAQTTPDADSRMDQPVVAHRVHRHDHVLKSAQDADNAADAETRRLNQQQLAQAGQSAPTPEGVTVIGPAQKGEYGTMEGQPATWPSNTTNPGATTTFRQNSPMTSPNNTVPPVDSPPATSN